MRIAITGIGIVSALGIGQKANEEGLLNGQTAVRAPYILPTVHQEWPIGEVPLTNNELKERLGKPGEELISRNILLGMLAAREAMADAKLKEEERHDMWFINGTTVGGMDLTEQFAGELFDGDMTHAGILRQHLAAATGEAIAQDLGGMKETATFSTACSSALNAIITGANLIRMREAKRVLVGGTEALTKFHLNGFASLGILSEQVCKPFDKDRDGINLGEGAAYLVLEEERAAQARGAKIYGYVAGYANRCDAYHPTASSPRGEGAFLAMQAALKMARLNPGKIDYINAHGTATPNNDASEAVAIERVFGTSFDDRRWPEPRSTKNLTGHTTSASGSIEVVFCLMLMRKRGYQYTMNNAFGFGGNDSSIVLSAKPASLPNRYPYHFEALRELSNVTDDLEVDQYISPMQKRRMSPQMRRLTVAVHKELARRGCKRPDGIVVCTKWGGIKPTLELLRTLITEGEQNFSPSLFMQSTHNSPATTLANVFGSHGYNTTCSVSDTNMPYAAGIEAIVPLKSGEAENVILCIFEEDVPQWSQWLEKAGIQNKPIAAACSYWRKEIIDPETDDTID